jgi:hypothetical protein
MKHTDRLMGPFREEFEIRILHHIHLVKHIVQQGIVLLLSLTRYYTFLMHLGN